MDHLHTKVQAGPRHIVHVTLDKSARVLVMDSLNYSAYRRGRPFRSYGGWAKVTPIRIPPPRCGEWHVVVDLEGQAGTVHAGVSLVQA